VCVFLRDWVRLLRCAGLFLVFSGRDAVFLSLRGGFCGAFGVRRSGFCFVAGHDGQRRFFYRL
jgi:hypothetical protein